MEKQQVEVSIDKKDVLAGRHGVIARALDLGLAEMGSDIRLSTKEDGDRLSVVLQRKQ